MLCVSQAAGASLSSMLIVPESAMPMRPSAGPVGSVTKASGAVPTA